MRAGDAAGRPRHGFSLVEMLAVMAIIGICLAMVIPHLGDNGSALSTETQTLAAFFDVARSVAMSRSTRTRVIFQNDPGDPEHYRRWAGLMVQAGTDPAGMPIWLDEGTPVLFPTGVFHFPAPPKDAAVPPPASMQARVAGRDSLCLAYEYEPTGMPVQASADVMLVRGFVEGGRLVVPRAEKRDGFRLRPYGGTTRFDRPEQLPAPTE